MGIVYNKFFDLAKENGITSYKLINCNIISASALQRMRKNDGVTIKTIDALCKALDCQPGDLMEYVPDKEA